jgi:multisubunit Na+/H+ antiporter MnhF subunit
MVSLVLSLCLLSPANNLIRGINPSINCKVLRIIAGQRARHTLDGQDMCPCMLVTIWQTYIRWFNIYLYISVNIIADWYSTDYTKNNYTIFWHGMCIYYALQTMHKDSHKAIKYTPAYLFWRKLIDANA